MGAKQTKQTALKKAEPVQYNRDSYETMEQFTDALRTAGLEKCNLLVAIDFTKSNTWQGAKTFNGTSLHYLSDACSPGEAKSYVSASAPPPAYHSGTDANGEPDVEYTKQQLYAPVKRSGSFARTLSFDAQNIHTSKTLLSQMNPYQYVLSVAGTQLESFDEDGIIPTCIFGHARGKNDSYIRAISPNLPNHCYKINEVLEAYESAVRNIGLSGNTQFAPILEWATEIVQQTGEYHILLIIGDGCIEDMQETRAALKKASKVPLSVIFVGVGDGSNPTEKDKWSSMRDLDDNPSGDVDNWQSVYLANIKDSLDNSDHPDVDLAIQMFMEIPSQYRYFKTHSMIRN